MAGAFAQFNTIPLHAKLKCLARLLRKPEAQYEDHRPQRSYNLSVFFKDVGDYHFELTFLERWETVLVIPGTENIGRVEKETPTLFSCLEVIKMKEPGGRGRPGKLVKINHKLNWNLLYVSIIFFLSSSTIVLMSLTHKFCCSRKRRG